MTGKQLKEIVQRVKDDAKIILFNDGSAYEWYGVEELHSSQVIDKGEIVYILFGQADEYEIAAVDRHYTKYLKEKSNNQSKSNNNEW